MRLAPTPISEDGILSQDSCTPTEFVTKLREICNEALANQSLMRKCLERFSVSPGVSDDVHVVEDSIVIGNIDDPDMRNDAVRTILMATMKAEERRFFQELDYTYGDNAILLEGSLNPHSLGVHLDRLSRWHAVKRYVIGMDRLVDLAINLGGFSKEAFGFAPADKETIQVTGQIGTLQNNIAVLSDGYRDPNLRAVHHLKTYAFVDPKFVGYYNAKAPVIEVNEVKGRTVAISYRHEFYFKLHRHQNDAVSIMRPYCPPLIIRKTDGR